MPFTWDFGFLLCNKTAWDAAREQPIEPAKANDEAPRVRDVWDRLVRLEGKPDQENTEHQPESAAAPNSPPVSWFEFVRAAKIVSEFQAYRTSSPVTAFDFTILTPESFSCLVLEMWFSEIYSSLTKYQERSGSHKERANLIAIRDREW